MIKNYHRPESIEAALQLQTDLKAQAVLLYHRSLSPLSFDETTEAVIDLQSLRLDTCTRHTSGCQIGSLVTLQAVVDNPATPKLLQEVAQAEAPSTFRNMQTLGGILQDASAESLLLAALLVLDAEVTLQTGAGTQTVALTSFLENRPAGGIITAITVATDGKTATVGVARTPRDIPIVAAAARRTPEGEVRLALCGVAAIPLLIDPTQLATLNPPGDFRGSSAYRRQMAVVLSRRVLNELG